MKRNKYELTPTTTTHLNLFQFQMQICVWLHKSVSEHLNVTRFRFHFKSGNAIGLTGIFITNSSSLVYRWPQSSYGHTFLHNTQRPQIMEPQTIIAANWPRYFSDLLWKLWPPGNTYPQICGFKVVAKNMMGPSRYYNGTILFSPLPLCSTEMFHWDLRKTHPGPKVSMHPSSDQP